MLHVRYEMLGSCGIRRSAALVNRLWNSSVPVISSGAMPSANLLRYMGPVLLHRDENRPPHRAADELRNMALPRRVLHQNDLSWADVSGLAVAGRDVHRAVEVDHVLAPRSGMPVDRVVPGGLSKRDA